MKKSNHPARNFLDLAQRRFRRARPGSVLILVVALLILMAIIGTAYMSMAQADRSTAVIHSNNTEVDLLVDGVVNLVKGTIVSDLFAQNSYRPSDRYNSGEAGTYNYITGLGESAVTVNSGTPFVSSRAPELFKELGGPAPGAPNPDPAVSVGNPPLWRYLTAPLVGGQFSSPVPPVHNANNTAFLVGENWASPPFVYSQRASIPGSFTLFPGAMPGTGLPAWVDNPTNPQRFFPAADADGDGIADSGYIKLPMGAVNGVTYYAAVRIVDNNAAVNATTAWKHNTFTSAYASPQLPGDFFTSNIDLLDLLHPNDADTVNQASGINLLLDYRFGKTAVPPAPTPTSPSFAYNDDNLHTQRTDFAYVTLMEAQFMGLNRRVKNPGVASVNPPNTFFYQPLSVNEALTMARNYVLRDPGVFSASLSTSVLEQYLQYTTSNQSSASTNQYSAGFGAGGVLQWYLDNFSHLASINTNGVSVVNARPLITSENSESQFVPSKYRDLGHISDDGTWSPTIPAGGFQFGDTVIWNGHRYVCITPVRAAGTAPYGAPIAPGAGAGLPGYGVGYRWPNPLPVPFPVSQAWAIDNDTWVYQPWTNYQTKTSINSGTFGQLMLSFWSVMAEKQRPTDHTWVPPFPIVPGTSPLVDSPRMFRSPTRYPHTPLTVSTDVGGAWRLSPSQVMQLRAAIAAVNAIDMRDSDDSVTARTVHLYDGDSVSQPQPLMQDVIATVYGTERQPFITKVYATNEINNSDPLNPQHGYIAVELYNPDPSRAISLSGWALGTINRFPPGTTYTTLTPPNLNPTLVPFDASDPPWYDGAGNKAPIIPPLGSIVVASNVSPPPGITLPPNVVKPNPITGALPVPTDVALYVVKNLVPVDPVTTPGGPWGAIGNELMLFKPRLADVTGAAVPSAWIGVGNTTPPPTGPTPLFPTGANDVANANPWPYYSEGTLGAGAFTPNPADMVPVDAYDFSGLNTLLNDADPPSEWYYVRPNDRASKAWHYVYPGHFAYATSAAAPYPPRLLDGTWSSDIPTPNAGVGAALTRANVPLAGQVPFGTEQTAAKAEYRDIPLVMNTVDFAGPNTFRQSPSIGENAVGFPYGGFARNGDVIQTPFIGAYRLAIIYPLNNPLGTLNILEMNPVTMDSVMALGLTQPTWGEIAEPYFTPLTVGTLTAATVGGDPAIDPAPLAFKAPVENVGRFAPMSPFDFLNPIPGLPNDFAAPPAGGANLAWMYHFATRLFDYVTVQSPQQDYVPDVDPGLSDPAQAPSTFTQIAGTQTLKFATGASTAPFPVPNSVATIFNAEPSNLNAATEETAPKYGLVNINTAPWRVLSAVPWVPPDYPSYSSDDGSRFRMNVNIGLSIARYRDIDDGTGAGRGHGPFKSIFELLDVPVYTFLPAPPSLSATPTLFRNILRLAPGPVAYNPDQGTLAPAYGLNPAPVYNDFQSKYIMMTRVSNLVTTRSDSFTAYVLIQGWQEPETSNAKLVVSRRTSFLIDRTKVTPDPSSRNPTITFIPSNH
jgi:hypothetical protein